MADRWVQVQGAPSTVLFTIHDLYNSAAVCIANRGSQPERVAVSVSVKSSAATDEQDIMSQFTLLSDPLGSGKPNTSGASPPPLGTAFAIVPPDSTVVAAVVSPRGNLRQLPSGLIVQVFSSSPDTTIATVAMTEAESSSREIDQWLKHRRTVGAPPAL